MKRYFLYLLVLPALILQACVTSARVDSTPVASSAPAATLQHTATPDSAQLATITPVTVGTPVSSVTPAPSVTPLPSPTISPSPRPSEAALWTWVSGNASANILAVNQRGEQLVAGKLTSAEYNNAHFEPIDAERAFLFLMEGTRLRVFLVGINDMREISLPGDALQIDPNYSRNGLSVVAVYSPGSAGANASTSGAAVFVYPVQTEWAGSNLHPYVGPLVWVDLGTLRAEILESSVSFEESSPRGWFHPSADGRYLRYIASNETSSEIRELDMQSATAKTIYTTRGSAYTLSTNPRGELWRSMRDKVMVKLDGKTEPFDDSTSLPRVLADGLVVVFPRSCSADCALKVTRPFGADPGLSYSLPWPLEDGLGLSGAAYLLPDQSLLVVGAAANSYSGAYPAVSKFQGLPKSDSPVFLLSPGGKSRLIGSYANIETDFRRPISGDGRYLLLKKPDQSAYFLYDAFSDRTLAEFPLKPGVERPRLGFRFQPAGVFIKFTYRGAGQDEWYLNSYSYALGAAQVGTVPQPDIPACFTVLSDGSLECWAMGAGGDTYNLVRFEPASAKFVVLAENVLALGDFGE